MARSLTTLKNLLDWRQPGGFVSVAGHATLLIVGLAAFSSAQPFKPAQEVRRWMSSPNASSTR